MAVRIPDNGDGALDRGGERSGRERLEPNSGALAKRELAVAGIAGRGWIDHRVAQATDRVDDRDRAIAHRIELAEPAWLEPRRHREQIAARVDPTSERGIETDPDRDVVAERLREPAEARFERRIAGAEHDETRTDSRQLGCDIGDEIDALLLGESRDHADHRAMVVGCEAELEL